MRTLSKQQLFKLATSDIVQGIISWRIWMLLGWQDIKLRYRRSQLGPFWITISMALTIYVMGFLHSSLFKTQMRNYFPSLATGMLVWSLISTIVNESTSAFTSASNYLKQLKMPYTIFALRSVVRNFIIFGHNILAIVPILIYYNIATLNWSLLALLIGLSIIFINGLTFGIIFGLLCARFRDISQIIVSLVGVAFFVTPIMWMPSLLPAKYSFILLYNPFAQFVSLIRLPLLGLWPSLYSYFFTASFTIIGIILMFLIYWRTRHKIIYWL